MDIFYRLNSPKNLMDLNDSFSRSSCEGFYFFLDNIQYSSVNNVFEKKSMRYLNTIKSLKKKVILTFDFNKIFNRPDYHSPRINEQIEKILKNKLENNIITKKIYQDEKEFFKAILKSNEDKIIRLRNLEDKENCFKKFREICQIYQNVQNYLEFEGILRFLPDENRRKTKVIGFEVPLIANYKIEDLNDPYFEKIQNSITKINHYLINFCQRSIDNFIYPLTIMSKDIKDNNQFYRNQLDYLKDFSKVLIWVIDSNELYSTRENQKLYFDTVNELTKQHHIYIKYVGIKQLQKYKINSKELSIIFREDAYSGYNINIQRYARPKRTRNILDPKDIKHKNDYNLSKENENSEFQCNCSICTKYEICTYKKALDLYYKKRVEEDDEFSAEISPKKEVKNEKKYTKKKVSEVQAKLGKIHNFEVADNLIFMDIGDFIKKYPIISKQINIR